MTYPLADAHVEFIHYPDEPATHHQISPEMINQVRPDLLFLACWVEPAEDAWFRLNKIIDGYTQAIADHGWQLVKHPSDLKLPGIKIILHLEDAAALTTINQLDTLFERGIRSVGLTHNNANQYAGGSLSDAGLTEKGVALIEAIAARGGILDWAHLNSRSVQDVARRWPALPLFISHAGLRSVHDTARNLDDATLDLVATRNGWLGLGLARSFLSNEPAKLADYAQQVAYASKRCGVDRVGVGSDLGGIISGLPAEIDGWLDIERLQTALVHPRQAGATLLSWLPSYFSALERL